MGERYLVFANGFPESSCQLLMGGHFRDLLLLFVSYGGPDEHNAPMFVFNGDFVDRGEHQIEAALQLRRSPDMTKCSSLFVFKTSSYIPLVLLR
eukprot:4123735-Amphidinium_carterae.1